MFLFETMLKPRYYLPLTSVSKSRFYSLWIGILCKQARFEYLTPSETTTVCPYKGMANCKSSFLLWTDECRLMYDRDYNVVVHGREHKDLIWWYKYPTSESAPIAGHLCFYEEKLELLIDDVLQLT